MPEVIDLLSSPPGSPSAPTKSSRVTTQSKSVPMLHSLDDLYTPDDPDFPISQPVKRRKLDGGRSFNQSAATHDEELPEIYLSSDVEISPHPRGLTRALSATFQSRIPYAIEHDRPSSSAPEPIQKASGGTEIVPLDISSDGLPEDPFSAMIDFEAHPAGNSAKRTAFSERTANVLANLPGRSSQAVKGKEKTTHVRDVYVQDKLHQLAARDNRSRLDAARLAEKIVDDIVFSSSPNYSSRPKKSRRANVEQESHNSNPSAANKIDKKAQKEAEKLKKQEEKAQKALEKQKAVDLAEANKSKINKKDSVSEMMVEVSSELVNTSIATQLEEHMKKLEVPLNFLQEEVNLTDDTESHQDIGCIVRWRRKTTAEYDNIDNQWVPKQQASVDYEQHILLHLNAVQFATMVVGNSAASAMIPYENMQQNVDEYITRLRSRHTDARFIVLIQGMQAWLKKSQNTRNREYIAAVRAQVNPEESSELSAIAPTSSQNKRKKPKKASLPSVNLSSVTDVVIEDLLLHIQLRHQPISIQHTTSNATTAFQITAFTQHLSTRPYRLAQLHHNINSASFCMDSGQIKTGDDEKDTYVKMLQEVQRVTVSMAYGIASEYETIQKLVQGFRDEGREMLADVRKSANKDGDWTDKRLGPQISRRLYKVFMGKDPMTTDGMS